MSEIAERFGVSVQQLEVFMKENRVDIDYHKSRHLGKKDDWLRALSKKAVGYKYKERKVTITEYNDRKKVYTEMSEKINHQTLKPFYGSLITLNN